MNPFFTLSVIDEITEVSTIDKRESSQFGQGTNDVHNNFQSDNYLGLSADHLPTRISILSSDTSYGEILPPDQSTLNIGKTLPPISAGSVGRSPSVRSEATSKAQPKHHSPRTSVALSDNGPMEATYLQPTISFPEPQLAFPLRSSAQSVHSSTRQHSPKKSLRSNSSFSSSSSSSSLSSSLSSHTARPPKAAPAFEEKPVVVPDTMQPSHRYSGQSSPPAYRSGSSDVKTPIARHTPPLAPSARSRSISSSSSSSSISSSSKSSASTVMAVNPNRVVSLVSARSDGSQASLRTMDDVMDEVATTLALRAKMQAETVTVAPDEQVKIGVCSTMSRSDGRQFMEVLASKIHHAMALHASYIFALFPGVNSSSNPATLVLCGAPQVLVTKAAILAGLRFKTRLAEIRDDENTWTGSLAPRPGSAAWAESGYDEEMLWDILRKTVIPSNPAKPPPDSRGVEELLAEAREKLDRLSPREAFDEALHDGILVDIRSESQRIKYGTIPGAIFIERSDLEWCFDPRSINTRLPIADRYDLRVIIYCQVDVLSSGIIDTPLTDKY
ncbi:hypothetical protein Clacol_008440 [Clathrus columnatus]|uniref:Rhodanese domain-containing protein n=1 Tax=Clathrus columnatus TaxID=1419009 RepID=A0AAV5AM22_9AGAM|nr:hypothetical protein Clacol_008440 [Clathrus columnatus]